MRTEPRLWRDRARRRVAGPGLCWVCRGGVVAALLASAGAGFGDDSLPAEALKRLSLEELAGLEVISVEKRAGTWWTSAAAVSVLTGEDVVRSGAPSLADSLRYVPGLTVGAVDANNWAIGSRGFADVFANKLLVMIDGRSVYTPLFSGVYWQYQDVLAEDLDRIEVVRGPGGALWGANAVNGVINILTKPAEQTQGFLASIGGGNLETAVASVRYGARLSETAAGRVYGKLTSRENFERADGAPSHDRWNGAQAGVRIDWVPTSESRFTLQSDVFGNSADQPFYQATLVPPGYGSVVEDRVDASGANVLGRWTRAFSGESELVVQAYYDRLHQEAEYYDFDVQVADLDVQQRFALGERHEVVAGAGYRRVSDRLDGGFKLDLAPTARETDLASVFVQDAIELSPDAWVLTLGTKGEHNDFTGFELQPGARLAWTPDERQTVWTSVARAVRSPSRAEHDLVGRPRALPPTGGGGVPTVLTITGDDRFVSEDLLAFEGGYRFRPVKTVSVELSVFYNDYRDLRTVEPGGVDASTVGAGYLTLPMRPDNLMDGCAYGGELAASWQVTAGWRLRGGYSWVRVETALSSKSGDPGAADVEGVSPRHQAFLVSQWDLPRNVTLDLGIRRVDALESLSVPGYTTADVRLAWRPCTDVEVSLTGRNLLDDRHPEAGGSPFNGSFAAEVPRSFLARLTLWF